MTEEEPYFHDFDVPQELKERYDIKRIAKEGSTILIQMDSKAVRFDVEPRFRNTVANFEKQAKGLGITDQKLKQEIVYYLSEQWLKILEGGNGGRKSPKEEEEEEERIEDTLKVAYNFKTMKDTKQIYYYDESKGIYVGNGDILIETLAESMTDGDITTSQVNEVMNHIRRQTYTERDEFDASRPEILNLQNGLLNINTLEFKEHSPDHLSLVQSPVMYDPTTKCPKILKFLGEVLHPQDVFTAMEVIGYCLYKSAEYEKAVMLVGTGANGKGVFLKTIEALVGLENSSLGYLYLAMTFAAQFEYLSSAPLNLCFCAHFLHYFLRDSLISCSFTLSSRCFVEGNSM